MDIKGNQGLTAGGRDLTTLRAQLPLLKAIQQQRARRKIESYYPATGPLRRDLYTKHMEFFAAGAKHRERLAMAANRVGKCTTIGSIIQTVEGPRSVGDLMAAAQPFAVWAWDGKRKVKAQATAPFKKAGLHHCYRLTMADGQFVECADHHRILTSAGWRFLADMLPQFGLSHLPSSSESGQQDPLVSDQRSTETLLSYLDRCSEGFRLDGEQPQTRANSDQASFRIQADARPHTSTSCSSDDPVSTHTSNAQPLGDRLSILYATLQSAAHSAASAIGTACTNVARLFDLSQAPQQYALASASELQSFPSVAPHICGTESASVDYPIVLASNRIISCNYIGLQEVYDFTVAVWHNYIAADLIHHNTEGIGAYEITLHLTGQYPDWWVGRRFTSSIKAWAAGDTSKTVREILQSKLLGEPGQHGTGMIPADTIVRVTPRPGVPDAVESIHVRHVGGKNSVLTLKSYDQKREAFQGTEQDLIWLDEEPPQDIYIECVVRTMPAGRFAGGAVMLTFTPINGWTEVVDLYMDEAARTKTGRYLIAATWDDAPHLSKQAKDELWATLPPHQRDARSRGIPALGSGAIYPLPEDQIGCEPFEIPEWWPRCYGLDVGWNRTAAVWAARDNESGIVYLYGEHYYAHSEAGENSRAIRGRGEWIPGVIDPASRGRSQADGQQLLRNYLENGLDVSPANNAVEAGIYQVWQAMLAGKLKVFRSLASWWAEFRKYRRGENGKIVKEGDHLMDATRYLWMSGRDRMALAPAPRKHGRGDFYDTPRVDGWMA